MRTSRIDWRLFLFAALPTSLFWGVLGYALFARYGFTQAVPFYLALLFLGIGVAGSVSSVYFSLRFKPDEKLRALAAAGGEGWVRHSFAERTVFKNKTLGGIVLRLSRRYTQRLLQTGFTESPLRLASETVLLVGVGSALAITLTLVSAYLILIKMVLIFPWGLLIIAGGVALPFILTLYPTVKLQNLLDDQRKGEIDELPFFVVYASIMQTVGVNLYTTMLTLIGAKTFEHLEQTALMLRRNVELFFKNQLEVIDEAARQTPNVIMRGLLSGYSSVWRSGGDIASFLDSKSGDMLQDAKFRWKRYADSVTDIGEVMVSVFFLIPMFVLTTAFLFPTQTLPTIGVTTFLVIPVFAMVVVFIVSREQPKTYDVINADWKPAAAAGIAAFAAGALVLGLSNPVFPLAFAIVASTFVYGMIVRGQRKEIGAIENALPFFLRDMTEYKKIGYAIQQAIIRLSEETTYNKVFDAKLRVIARQLSLNMRLSEADARMRSWIGKVCFFLLGEIVESGGGTVQGLENVTNFITEMTRAKREARSVMKLYEILSYITPAGLAFSVSLMSSLIRAFGGIFSLGNTGSTIGTLTQVPALSTEFTGIMIIMVALAMGLTTSKSVDFTTKSTLRITVNVVIALVALVVSSTAAASLISTSAGG